MVFEICPLFLQNTSKNGVFVKMCHFQYFTLFTTGSCFDAAFIVMCLVLLFYDPAVLGCKFEHKQNHEPIVIPIDMYIYIFCFAHENDNNAFWFMDVEV